MTSMNDTGNARRSRRVRTRLTRVLVLAVAGPLMAGSLAYAAGVGPVRRPVDEFLKGTAGFFRKAESSKGDFHLSPNPAGQGVLIMPGNDHGPRPSSEHDNASGVGNSKDKKSRSDSEDSKETSRPEVKGSMNDTSDSGSEESGTDDSDSGSEESKEEESGTSTKDSKDSDSEPDAHVEEASDHKDHGSEDSRDSKKDGSDSRSSGSAGESSGSSHEESVSGKD